MPIQIGDHNCFHMGNRITTGGIYAYTRGTNLGRGGGGEGTRARHPTRERLHHDSERAQRHGTDGPVGSPDLEADGEAS